MALKPYPYPCTFLSLSSFSYTSKISRIRYFPAAPTLNEPTKLHLLHSLPTVQSRSVCKMNGSGIIVTLPAAALVGSRTTLTRPFFKVLHCAPFHQQQQEVDGGGIMCEPCNGKGWLLCDFCKGQKTNVKADNKRIYRRCPSCRAIGYLLCTKCKVFKCVTFPNGSDGEELTF